MRIASIVVATSLIILASGGPVFAQTASQCSAARATVANCNKKSGTVLHKKSATGTKPVTPPAAPVVQAAPPASPPPPEPSKFEQMMVVVLAGQSDAEKFAAEARLSDAEARKAEAEVKLVVANTESQRLNQVEVKDAATRDKLADIEGRRATNEGKYLHTMGNVAKWNVVANFADIGISPLVAKLGATKINNSTSMSQVATPTATAPTTVTSQGGAGATTGAINVAGASVNNVGNSPTSTSVTSNGGNVSGSGNSNNIVKTGAVNTSAVAPTTVQGSTASASTGAISNATSVVANPTATAAGAPVNVSSTSNGGSATGGNATGGSSSSSATGGSSTATGGNSSSCR